MLNPVNDRLDYGQVLAPPVDYKLDFAVGTTYSLDLDALVGATLALGLSEETDSDVMKNPIWLLEALRTTGDKIALFCEGGQIKKPNNATALYVLLEKMVFQVVVKSKKKDFRSFHPKFWLIKYVNAKKEAIYRVVVLSRNLTFDRSWDVTFCMDGKATNETTTKNKPIADFLEYLMWSLTNDENGNAKKKRIRALIRELEKVHFSLDSKQFTDFEFLPVGIEGHKADDAAFNPLFTDSFHELVVMSPFLSNPIIKEFNSRNKHIEHPRLMLFTRAMSLPRLKKEDCSNFEIYTMREEVIEGESAVSEDSSDIQKQDIHAKIFMVRKYGDSYLYLGSLNASGNGKDGNVEFMMMLKSTNRYLNAKSLSESFFCGEFDNPDNPFQVANISENAAVDDEDELQKELSGFIKEVTRMKSTAKVIENGQSYDICVSFPYCKAENTSIQLSPLFKEDDKPLSKSLVFSGLNLTQLSHFYRITASKDGHSVQKVLIIPTENMPEDREKTIISNVISNEDCFCRYVAFLLGDNSVLSSLDVVNSSEGAGDIVGNNAPLLPALYEKMLYTAATSPDRFKEIESLIRMISPEGVVPEEFVELYDTIKKVVKING